VLQKLQLQTRRVVMLHPGVGGGGGGFLAPRAFGTVLFPFGGAVQVQVKSVDPQLGKRLVSTLEPIK
jgi:hypothetical protein